MRRLRVGQRPCVPEIYTGARVLCDAGGMSLVVLIVGAFAERQVPPVAWSRKGQKKRLNAEATIGERTTPLYT